MRRNRLGNHVDNLELDMTNKEYNWLGWLILTAFIFTGIGYAYRYGQGVNEYDRGYEAAITEMDVLVKGEICK